MKIRSVLVFIAVAAAPSPGDAQVLSESVDGLYRVCTYLGASGLSGSTRTHRVGLARNCPATYPSPISVLPPPPTARLLAEQMLEGSRECSYEEAGSVWVRNIPPHMRCPLAAGMLPAADSGAAHRR